MFKKISPLACLTALSACTPMNVTTTPQPSPVPLVSPLEVVPTPTPQLMPSSSPLPSVIPTEAPTAIPTATPYPAPTAVFTATPSPVPTPTSEITNAPTPIPLPIATADILVVGKTTFQGTVFGDAHIPLDGASVKVKSLNSNTPFQAETVTAGGTFTFNNAPSGVQIEIVVTKSGHVIRHRTEVLKSNKSADPNINRFDFGTNGSNTNFGVDYNAISDKPEVISVVPEANASDVPPNGGADLEYYNGNTDPQAYFALKLKFSEPIDRETVRNNFEIRTFSSKKLSVDLGSASQTLTGSGDSELLTGTRIWDKAAFHIIWNNDDTEATFLFNNERGLPTDRDASRIPDYQVSLSRDDGIIKDKSGISRGANEKKFKLTDMDFTNSYKFKVRSDEIKPSITSIIADTKENGGYSGDAIKVRFSERMAHYTLGPVIAGGMDGNFSQAVAGGFGLTTSNAAAANYIVTVTRAGGVILNEVTWASLGGGAVFDTSDPTHKTVLLLPPTANTDLYKPGDVVAVKLENTVVDPAGNAISTPGNIVSGTAT